MSNPGKTGRWVLLLALAVCFTVAAIISVGRRTMHMTSAMAAAADQNTLAQLALGSKTQAVIEITAIDQPGNARGQLLARERDDLYRRTTTSLKVHYSDSTPFVMGKRDDLRANAIVHVKGTVNEDHTIAADQIVILTGYVQVQ